MSMDGISIYGVLCELKKNIIGERIDKIHQPYRDEVVLSLRGKNGAQKLLLSANPSHPRIHITSIQKENPMTPPMFTMILRKYISGGRITGISQPDFERIVFIDIESSNEMGDLSEKRLILEIMGKHSNIILCDDKGIILDSAKRITHEKSSVREVLPGREYTLPPNDKKNPLSAEKPEFLELCSQKSAQKLQNIIYQSYTGISPVSASEIVLRADLDPSDCPERVSQNDLEKLYSAFAQYFSELKAEDFHPAMYYENGKIKDFAILKSLIFSLSEKKEFGSISELFEGFYAQRDASYNLNQRTHDLKKIVTNAYERCVKKKEAQLKTLEDIKDKDSWRLKGELLTAYIYEVKKGMTKISLTDFYSEDGRQVEIALDPQKTPSENAQKYFSKYNKAKRTETALAVQLEENERLMEYLEGVSAAIDTAENEADIREIRRELGETGFLKRQNEGKKQKSPRKSAPMHFISSEGFHIFVGKSNTQNDYLTMQFAKPRDIWMHTKKIAGSHVIIVSNNTEIPETAIKEGALLAAYYSKGRESSSVPVDYTFKKFVKKPSGAKPGLVIYETNSTIYVTPSEEDVKRIKRVDA
ncbi:MAG: NFACT family protein [Firmicutes bacterium]|nr:NFACT family protein [Bacillota bacterium]